jgi:hypothetical protein
VLQLPNGPHPVGGQEALDGGAKRRRTRRRNGSARIIFKGVIAFVYELAFFSPRILNDNEEE